MDKYKKKKGQKQLDKEIAQELADQLLNWEDDMMPLEVDDEDDLNWAFLDHLFLTDLIHYNCSLATGMKIYYFLILI
jgi:hypothetical protein